MLTNTNTKRNKDFWRVVYRNNQGDFRTSGVRDMEFDLAYAVCEKQNKAFYTKFWLEPANVKVGSCEPIEFKKEFDSWNRIKVS